MFCAKSWSLFAYRSNSDIEGLRLLVLRIIEMSSLTSTVNALLAKSDRPAVRAFFLSMAALTVALILALYSGAAAQLGNLFLASATALTALVVAGWVAVTLVPTLAKRTPLRWIGYRMEYRITGMGGFTSSASCWWPWRRSTLATIYCSSFWPASSPAF